MAEPVEIVLLAKDQFSGVLGQAREALASLNPAAGLVVGALAAVGSAMYKAAMDTVDYADEVRKMMQLTGESAEESSRVIQVMDDYKVSVATLTTATRVLSRQGLSLNIETLAKLSDEYTKLRTGAEKTAFLIEKFGRSGLQMAEAMEQGGAAIRAASDAMDEHLVLTADEVKAARDYQKQVDNLNDSLMAVKVTIGTGVVPVMVNALKIFDVSARALGGFVEQMWAAHYAWQQTEKFSEYMKSWADWAATLLNSNPLAFSNDVAKGVENLANNYQGLADKMGMIPQKAADIAEEIATMTDRNKEYMSIIGKIASADENYQKTKTDLLFQNTQLERARADEAARGWAADQSRIAEYSASIYNNNVAIQANEDAHRKASTQIIFDLLQQKLAQDGLTDAELNYLLEKGQAWGMYSATVVAEAKKAIQEANNLASAINSIPTDKDINFHIKQFGTLPTIGGGGVTAPKFEMRAAGGPVNMGQSYIVGEKGPELFTPSRSGAIIPNNAMGGGNVNLSVNVTGGIINDPQEVGRQMIPALRYALRQLGMAA